MPEFPWRVKRMNDSLKPKSDGPTLPRVTLAAAFLVLILALGSVFFPHSGQYEMHEILLVYDTPGVNAGRDVFFRSLAQTLEKISGHPMKLVVAESRGEFLRLAVAGVDFILSPDGLALELEPTQYSQMASGRRKAPSNLRPQGVMVYRKSAGCVERPWESHPRRTVFGDSLSLVCMGGIGSGLRAEGCSFGPDPYDHGSVLHALRLGAFDFALVRQWDADDFFSSGLLDSAVWGLKKRTVPVPDIVVMASQEIPLVDRLQWADTLALTGRSGQPASESTEMMVHNLDKLGLVGFNILLEPDFEMVRRIFARHWPVATD